MTEPSGFPEPEAPEDAFAAVIALRRHAGALEQTAVDNALARGWTWAQIGQALDMTPQAAHKRLSPSRRANPR
jgi:hypothetical protein